MFTQSESTYIIQSMRDDRVVLFLGAGASYGSETSKGEMIPLGEGLESFLRGLIGSQEQNLRLEQVAKDVRKIYGEAGLKKKLEEKFLETRPSSELIDLFSYKWNRCYTLNYDDTIQGIPRKSKAQRHKYLVGTDKIEEPDSSEELQVIHLNGSILQYEKGIVLTDNEFRARIRKHTPWYEQCAADYSSKTFLFIGTKLDEPIFKAYVESLEDVSSFARSFLITPSPVPPRDIEDLQQLNIQVKQNTLGDLVGWLNLSAAEIEGKGGNAEKFSTELAPVSTGHLA